MQANLVLAIFAGGFVLRLLIIPIQVIEHRHGSNPHKPFKAVRLGAMSEASLCGVLTVLLSLAITSGINTTSLQPIRIPADGVVTWKLEGVDPLSVSSEMDAIARALTAEQGWERAGVEFRLATKGKAMISFIRLGKHQFGQFCNAATDSACTSRPSPDHCQVSIEESRQIDPHLVGHEVGHCFGFKHAKTGIMGTGGTEQYPSKEEIEKLGGQVGR